MSLALLWKELSLGLCRVVDNFCTRSRLVLVTRAVAPGERLVTPPPSPLRVLETVLGGACQNSVAIDLELAPSTVATLARSAMESLGVKCRPSHAPPLLMLAARAARELDAQRRGSVSFIDHCGETLRVIGLDWPSLALAGVPPAERAVLRGLFEGLTHAEIATQRGTATRTVANQLSAMFRRFSVSGRTELIQRLFELECSANR
jgi:DNA-binding NarL/FixJ family response regulator